MKRGTAMLNYLWAGMMAFGIVWGAVHGNLAAVTNGALESAKEAVTLAITMLGILGFWSGVLEIGNRAGLIEALSRKMHPFLHFLFPTIPKDHPAEKAIAANMIANILGLGWAATPAGLLAMESLEQLEEERRSKQEDEREEKRYPKENNRGKKLGRKKRTVWQKGTANDEMCTFLVLNISSLQLIPVNMIAYRSQYGSADPTAIVGPAILATLISTVVGILFCKIKSR